MAIQDTTGASIAGTQLYNDILAVAMVAENMKFIEVGAGIGDGITRALIRGMLSKPNAMNPGSGLQLHCIELSEEKYQLLQSELSPYGVFSFAHNGVSADLSWYMSEEAVREFYHSKKTRASERPVEVILSSRSKELEYIDSKGESFSQNILNEIKGVYGIPDVLVMNGSEFTSVQEMELMIGARYIVLIQNDNLKNYDNHNALLGSESGYRLVIEGQSRLGGYSIFRILELEEGP
ncbi:MAG: hypothetical protein DWQ44_08955 [Bacteroidetes bacterium]|nr:MAG: hypothetical protein DWQ33_02820 [Bacteroidota bacterium]REK06418.1 MAG: hypothetical protein DWQ39_02745 [Bacteroidota bacterium]REK33184.1 MAG: hypothetical protein DWQ44_08955 [Bacteroidota bacterium]REK47020.1 MAG: hypothetical protein DWQ48_13285 [Bacteroidota bacterium]